MNRPTLDEIEAMKIGELARQRHRELTGEELRWMEFPCMDAVYYAMQAVRESETAVAELLNDH